ncbi:hypothetical protein G6L63_11335 [Agrobacterium vitis]|uniref:Uncharacterized protein n=1 Tax=Agrobacterium vitis TaxID=373 RepID=A0A368NGG6_AGRVI|nr:hypothetical protein [Agrobacterium vitis]KAA3512586.1 hypothetical protein DXM22_15085 [Agrobacterium vitis]KAA3525954.1 hypothetical protein DXT89_15505 [Agrobacterium vitis]MUZ99094.1 hypothetical protein [Agrobacterium vitis]MVA31635.1 hypothetical protein [Agrobacterium vitis]NOJ33738.1 hypothetical protein [Agrobacterium vitis]
MIPDERKREFEAAIRRDIPRNMLVEVRTLFPRAAEQADVAVSTSHKAVTDGLPLSRYRQSRSVGLMRYNIIDEAFEQILARNGAEFVKSVPVEYTPDEVKLAPVHLTTGVLGHTMVGFASHRELIDTPVKNATRRALCYQNRGLLPDFFHPPEMFSDRQRLVLIMVRRDPNVLGNIASLTLSVLDSKQETFIYQSDIDDFLANYGADGAASAKRRVVLKPIKGGFKDASGDGSRDQNEK